MMAKSKRSWSFSRQLTRSGTACSAACTGLIAGWAGCSKLLQLAGDGRQRLAKVGVVLGQLLNSSDIDAIGIAGVQLNAVLL